MEKTISGAFEKLSSHEEICAERYRNINLQLAAQGSQLSLIIKTITGLVIVLIGWLAAQVYALQPLRHEPPTPPAADGSR